MPLEALQQAMEIVKETYNHWHVHQMHRSIVCPNLQLSCPEILDKYQQIQNENPAIFYNFERRTVDWINESSLEKIEILTGITDECEPIAGLRLGLKITAQREGSVVHVFSYLDFKQILVSDASQNKRILQLLEMRRDEINPWLSERIKWIRHSISRLMTQARATRHGG